MENIPISQVGDQLHIGGFPDAAAIVQLTGQKARRLADLRLHEADLEFAMECLLSINSQLEPEAGTIRESLWRSAITHFMKCFGKNKARSFSLQPSQIYKSDRVNALDAFKTFSALRDKHIVHDENSFSQAIPGAILSRASKPYKVEKIVCLFTRRDLLENGHWANLHLLVEQALTWVRGEFDLCCNELTAELELLDRNVLLAKPAIVLTPQTHKDLFIRRQLL